VYEPGTEKGAVRPRLEAFSSERHGMASGKRLAALVSTRSQALAEQSFDPRKHDPMLYVARTLIEVMQKAGVSNDDAQEALKNNPDLVGNVLHAVLDQANEVTRHTIGVSVSSAASGSSMDCRLQPAMLH